MILKIFTIYDSKVEAYMQPFFMQSKGAALRAFTDTISDRSTQFSKHPQDFTLFEIGEYDDSTGTLLNYDAKISLGVAVEFQKDAP
ncbi:nonstructural protein [Flyfo microvirus Tbat2_160]|nr:nonstructural protein [Flyfo microvirus Tbat2_160]